MPDPPSLGHNIDWCFTIDVRLPCTAVGCSAIQADVNIQARSHLPLGRAETNPDCKDSIQYLKTFCLEFDSPC